MALTHVVVLPPDPSKACEAELVAQLARVESLAKDLLLTAGNLKQMGNLGHPQDACYHAGRVRSMADMIAMLSTQLKMMDPTQQHKFLEITLSPEIPK
jgi:hypothetical protein